ncbi:AAA family ATPase [Ornithinimicrobium avium]|uniref:ATP-dependent Clp protease ATP-binding subunit n=1 Tax=Ornithinimicrobium avium TaxID=2283195 RepID=A0A345NK92_9MICO|nr:AAA family ATPase [Ornithinimicrobium avium]AXH95450.1 ATP-dependent Clp protease ATP-binding subunit [Ornithinimicrobium avium]
MTSTARLPDGSPHWLVDMDATLPVTGQYVVHGNLRDQHLIPAVDPTSPPHFMETLAALWWSLRRSGYSYLLRHDPVAGLQLVADSDPVVVETSRRAALEVLSGATARIGGPVSADALVEVVQRVARNAQWRGGIVLDYLSQLRVDGEPYPDDVQRLMVASLAEVHAAPAFRQPEGARQGLLPNARFWLVDRPADLPAWMVGGSEGIRQVPLSTPDLTTREAAARVLVRHLPDPPTEQESYDGLVMRFRDVTEGMTVRGMIQTVQLARESGTVAEKVEDSVRAYRVGLTENKWEKTSLRQAIGRAEQALGERVLGQERAVRHVSDILVRTTLGLTSAQLGKGGGGPRGILFFAGPTGVGKTELAKQMTALIFGDADAYIRFDMSEFSAEHTEARLIGSPPGYVGHGSGGELTNAVRQRPFSVVLFDEIEKAHPRILDKFLQILSDGRLTDGSGATVHFSETVIVFTSNLGIAEAEQIMVNDPTADHGEVMKAVIRDQFTHPHKFNRPELLGRIGDNIVVFDYLSEEVAGQLGARFVSNVLERVASASGITLTVATAARRDLVAACASDRSTGGRGVGLKVESLFVNPLARQLIHQRGDRARVTSFQVVDGEGHVEVEWS